MVYQYNIPKGITDEIFKRRTEEKTTEYELMGTIELNFTCDTLGKLNENKIKTLFKKILEKYLDENDNVSCIEDPVGEVELNFDYEKQE